MKATVLTDNTAREPLCGEWGLSVYIEHNGHTVLLDTGETDLFLQNARKLGVPIEDVEVGVLSHAHYDHSDGMPAFFEANRHAKFLLRAAAKQKCYDIGKEPPKYIGIRDGILETYGDRIVYLDRDAELYPGAWVIGHHTEGLAKQGERASMYTPDGNGWTPDAFQHEQSLVLEVDGGIAVFSSCTHAGAETVVLEAMERFPGRAVRALIGGLHLFIRTEEEVRALAGELRRLGVEKIITGHCTGDAAFAVLARELGSAVDTLYCGKIIEL